MTDQCAECGFVYDVGEAPERVEFDGYAAQDPGAVEALTAGIEKAEGALSQAEHGHVGFGAHGEITQLGPLNDLRGIGCRARDDVLDGHAERASPAVPSIAGLRASLRACATERSIWRMPRSKKNSPSKAGTSWSSQVARGS